MSQCCGRQAAYIACLPACQAVPYARGDVDSTVADEGLLHVLFCTLLLEGPSCYTMDLRTVPAQAT
jgi:hypothetical protein